MRCTRTLLRWRYDHFAWTSYRLSSILPSNPWEGNGNMNHVRFQPESHATGATETSDPKAEPTRGISPTFPLASAHDRSGLFARRASATVALTFVVLIGANALAWAWAWWLFCDQPVLLGSAFLAYVFGLRHAVDADHIAAIDNVVRKLMRNDRKAFHAKPFHVGLYFSLGHSTVVILASAAI